MNEHVRTYLRHLPAITGVLDALEVPFYFSNALFMVSRLAASPGWTAREVDGGLIIDANREWCAVLPITADREAFTRMVTGAVGPGCPALRLPRWMLARLREFQLGQLWPDYIGSTAALQTMAGRKLKRLRQTINKVERSGRAEVVRLGPAHAADAAAITRDWYAARAPALGKMYLKTENLWLFENLGWVLDNVPEVWGVGVAIDGALQAVNLSCVLSETSWCCHTERYRPGVMTYANQLAFREACRAVDAVRLPWVNDGVAGTEYKPGVDDLAAFKHRIAEHTISSFGAWEAPA